MVWPKLIESWSNRNFGCYPYIGAWLDWKRSHFVACSDWECGQRWIARLAPLVSSMGRVHGQ